MLLDIGVDMKPIKTFVALPILVTGLLILSVGSAVFCLGASIAEHKLVGRKK